MNRTRSLVPAVALLVALGISGCSSNSGVAPADSSAPTSGQPTDPSSPPGAPARNDGESLPPLDGYTWTDTDAFMSAVAGNLSQSDVVKQVLAAGAAPNGSDAPVASVAAVFYDDVVAQRFDTDVQAAIAGAAQAATTIIPGLTSTKVYTVESRPVAIVEGASYSIASCYISGGLMVQVGGQDSEQVKSVMGQMVAASI